MPTYLYQCAMHGEFEHQHSITEELEDCPLCIAEQKEPPLKVKRLIASSGGFILMGGGWAKDNYR